MANSIGMEEVAIYDISTRTAMVVVEGSGALSTAFEMASLMGDAYAVTAQPEIGTRYGVKFDHRFTACIKLWKMDGYVHI